ncbi:exo-beta-N-acetylmuramidase NamZ domain-containing protein [Deinococcus frigens]|uniref:exo-beta-N-acetylmuramidase NamZ family protein n=1 Tax=Deinococcus frigens TaxID=249403 RepID=UPI000A888A4E|nr:DUF1343 domain-containing protein [Deinococcus frigens]
MNAGSFRDPPQVGLERLLATVEAADAWGRVGLLTNPSGVTRDLIPSAVALSRAGLTLDRLLGPEHGVDGSGAPGEAPELERDAASGLPTCVLYHLSDEETARRLAGLDTLLVDLQDVGVRFYTYISTVRDALRAARTLGLRVVVLDRPNPIGFAVEGPLLEPAFESYVGISSALPLRHGLTIGEVVRLLAAGEGVGAEVLPTDAPDGWHTGRPWVPPSPNLPDLAAAQLYPAGALVEALDASEGRGTALPFRQFGAPGLDAHALAARLNALDLGVTARPAFFTPTTSKHAGQRCAGVQLHPDSDATLPELLPLGLALFTALEEAGAARNSNWLQKLLGVPAGKVPATPEAALAMLPGWQRAAQEQAQVLSPHRLYAR